MDEFGFVVFVVGEDEGVLVFGGVYYVIVDVFYFCYIVVDMLCDKFWIVLV